MGSNQAWCQLWSIRNIDDPIQRESELCSLHASKEDVEAFMKAYAAAFPKHTPEVYSTVARDARQCTIPAYECNVDDRTYARLQNHDKGVWSVTIPPRTMDATAFIPPTDLLPFRDGVPV